MSLQAQHTDHQLPILHDSEQPASARRGPSPLLTPAKQAEFCERLSQHGNVRLACRALGISSQTAYRARRASSAMRACWDAAIVIARHAVEEVLADRAINGVEESVFYHGEEVATRRRFDSRLLLAHLARLDARAARLGACTRCDAPLEAEAGFDAALAGLEEGRDLPSGLCSMCSTLGPALDATIAGDAAPSDTEIAPCEDCGGQCSDPDAELSQDDCMWLGNRLDRMEAARPSDVEEPHQLTTGEEEDAGAIEMRQLLAFEEGVAHWWLIVTEAELSARLLTPTGEGGGASFAEPAPGEADARRNFPN